MRSFALIAMLGLANAGYGSSNGNGNYGTTGHYGNQYGHAGRDDHSHNDHIYGYDSVPAEKFLKSGDGQTLNGTKRTNILVSIASANDARKTYLTEVLAKRIQRLSEIKMQNLREIRAPFEYQTELLDKEIDDVTVAMTEALLDVNNAWEDLQDRLQQLRDDKVAALALEITEITRAIDRATTDQKQVCQVMRALRADILRNIDCGVADPAVVTYDPDFDVTEFRLYEGLFDDFHYDIGHGKGTGEGSVDSAPVVDGYGGQAPSHGPVGDWEQDVGAATRSWEGNLYAQY